MLSFVYRLLSSFKTQDEVTQDMQLTFEDARTDARARGWWSYSIFSVKEIAGLIGLPTGERWWLRTAGWGLAGLAAGWILSFFLPIRYTSEATLRLTPAIVSLDLLPHDTVNVEHLLDIEKSAVLSRGVLTTIVDNFDLYPNHRKREAMDELVKEFRKSIRIERIGPNLIRIAFTYGDSRRAADGILAQKVVQDLDFRLIAEMLRQRSNSAIATAQFFKDQVDKAGESWLSLSATVKSTPASDARYELLVLERDQKRKEYESLAQKLGTAQTLVDSEHRGQGATLELLDAASIPYQPDTPLSVILLAGLGCGSIVGLLSALWRASRRITPGFTVPSAVEPA